jgi:hypothetical protein
MVFENIAGGRRTDTWGGIAVKIAAAAIVVPPGSRYH